MVPTPLDASAAVTVNVSMTTTVDATRSWPKGRGALLSTGRNNPDHDNDFDKDHKSPKKRSEADVELLRLLTAVQQQYKGGGSPSSPLNSGGKKAIIKERDKEELAQYLESINGPLSDDEEEGKEQQDEKGNGTLSQQMNRSWSSPLNYMRTRLSGNSSTDECKTPEVDEKAEVKNDEELEEEQAGMKENERKGDSRSDEGVADPSNWPSSMSYIRTFIGSKANVNSTKGSDTNNSYIDLSEKARQIEASLMQSYELAQTSRKNTSVKENHEVSGTLYTVSLSDGEDDDTGRESKLDQHQGKDGNPKCWCSGSNAFTDEKFGVSCQLCSSKQLEFKTAEGSKEETEVQHDEKCQSPRSVVETIKIMPSPNSSNSSGKASATVSSPRKGILSLPILFHSPEAKSSPPPDSHLKENTADNPSKKQPHKQRQMEKEDLVRQKNKIQAKLVSQDLCNIRVSLESAAKSKTTSPYNNDDQMIQISQDVLLARSVQMLKQKQQEMEPTPTRLFSRFWSSS